MADESKNDELVAIIEQMLNNRKHEPFWSKHLSTIVTVVVLAFGVTGAWYTNKASVKQLSEMHDKLEDKLLKNENRIHDVELRVVQESSDLKSLKEHVTEIKSDVKDIKNKLFGL